MSVIKFYSSHCPKCKVLKKLMDDKKIEYEEIDNESIYMKVARENRIMSMPFAEINGRVVGTKELQKYIMEV
jgi:glutaredoxin